MNDANSSLVGESNHVSKSLLEEINRTLERFDQPSNIHGWMRIATNWFFIAFCSLAYFAFPFIHSIPAKVALYFFSICIIGGRQRGLEGCMHEATHHALFKQRGWNRRFQFLYAWPVLDSVESYQREHMIHHYRFGSVDDPTLDYYHRIGIMDLKNSSRFKFYWIVLIKPLLGYSTWWYLRYSVYRGIKSNWKYSWPVLIFWVSVFISFYLMNGLSFLFLFYVVPLFTVYPVLIHFSEVLDHAALYDRQIIDNTRNNLGRIIHRYFIHPHNDGFHLIHHLRPTIPAHLLNKAYQACQKIPEFKRLTVESKNFWMGIEQMKEAS